MTCPKQHAVRAAVFAFRCAWHRGETRDLAVAAALRAYRDLLPEDDDASDQVVAAIIEAIRLRPHWIGAGG
jgi:hypothetical protein